MVNTQSFLNSLRLVIITKDQLCATGVTDTLFFRCCIYQMISSSASYACTTSAHTFYNVLIRNFYVNRIINCIIQFGKCCVQALCLRNGTRETIKDITFLAVILLYAIYDQVAYQLIRNKKSLIHICFCFLSKLCSVFDICTENISGGDVRNLIFLSNFLCLSSFSSSRST